MSKRALGGRFGTPRKSKGDMPLSDRGGQFFCTTQGSGRYSQVLAFLEHNKLVGRWDGRFGVLGARGGSFLPKEIIDGSVLGGLQRAKVHESEDGEANPENSDQSIEGGGQFGDFCGFLAGGSKSELYVGTPSMSSVCDRLAELAEVEVRKGVEVTDLRLDGDTWTVGSSSAQPSDKGFQALVVATHNPALAAGVVSRLAIGMDELPDSAVGDATSHQIAERLRGLSSALENLRKQHKAPLYSLSISFPVGTLSENLNFDAVACPTSDKIQFVSREASKPGRSNPNELTETWTAITTSAYAQDLLKRDLDEEAATSELVEAFVKLVKPALGDSVDNIVPSAASAKRWKAGFTTRSLGLQEDSIGLEPWKLVICGDFLRSYASPGEAAVLSGMEGGEKVASWFPNMGTDHHP